LIKLPHFYRVTQEDDATKIADYTGEGETFLEEKFKYRKPGAGILYQATFDYGIHWTQSWMVGDRPENEAATVAGVNFMDADTWRNQFLPGMYEIRSATPKYVKFLEGIKLS
jgi:D-glycero-D-manno-heptose 1,7-bisphosphate phosphatase